MNLIDWLKNGKTDVFSEHCNAVLRSEFLTTVSMNFNTNTVENPTAYIYPEDEGTNLLRTIGKSLQDHTLSHKKNASKFHNN
jgi:hypothetical protein